MTQFTKAEVGFEHPAKGPNRCAQCAHFEPERKACAIVKGHIDPEDWCEKFEPAVRKFAHGRSS